MKKCIQRNKIPEDKIVYMKNNKEYNAQYKLADVYVEEEYVRNHILNVEEQKRKKEEEANARKDFRDEIIRKRKEMDENVEEAPVLVELSEEEMFKNDNGECMEIETRGKKTQEGIFFKASDIAKAFDHERVLEIITNIQSDYVYGRDFKYFKYPFDPIHYGTNGLINQSIKKCIFLTYDGVLKILFSTKGDRGVRFRKWASNKLFILQMGSQDEKDKLAAEVLGVDHRTVVDTFRKSCGPVSCVYLFCIGKVKDMRQYFDLDQFASDEDYVYKYGMTSDMGRRSKEHMKKYSKLKNNTFELKYYAYIDKSFVSKAETHMRGYYNAFNMEVNDANNVELIVVDKERLATIRQLFSDMYVQYSGQNSELISKLQELQNELVLKDKDYENSRLMMELKLRDCELRLRDSELRARDTELMYLRRLNELNEK